MYAYEVKLKNFFVRGGSARNLEETEGASPAEPVAPFPRLFPPPPPPPHFYCFPSSSSSSTLCTCVLFIYLSFSAK